MRIGLDIGGTKTDAVLIGPDNHIHRSLRYATGRGADAVVDTIVHAVADVVRDESVDAIGIGIPGVVDTTSGHVFHAVNLDIAELDLARIIEHRTAISVRVENDVKAAALGAWHLLNLRGSAAYLNLGTGLSAGVVIHGELWRGAWGSAGELGHIPIDPQGPLCNCGQRGCLETVASGGGIARWWESSAAFPVRDLFDRADSGDPAAQQARERVVDGVASALRILALTVDVETIVIGGGLSRLGDRVILPVMARIRDWETHSPFVASLRLSSRILCAPHGAHLASIGAALIGVPTQR